jgi:hypothetical protein
MANNNNLMKYASLGFQFFVGLGLFMYLGKKGDDFLKLSMPLCIWIFPLVFIVGSIIKIIIETSKQKNK